MKLSNIDQVTVAQEFHISVTPLGEDQYLVRIERVVPGVPLAQEQVSWAVEDWLAQARQLMNDPLLGLLEGNAAFVDDIFFLPEWDEPVSPSARNLVELGQELYNSLFQGSLRDSWMMAQAIAQNQRQVLRLRLGLKGTRLPRLPWEVLHGGDRPLATGTDVAFSRYQLSTGRMGPIETSASQRNQRLKILMVVSGPSDQETLELAEEASDLQKELRSRSPDEPPAIQLTILEQPGREQLTQALEQGQYQVFHYAGHSNLGDSGGNLYLVSSKTGLTETLNGDDLAGLLVNNGIQLAVFNSCRGSYTAAASAVEHGKERNLAEALVKRGIPSVLAMAERIPDEVALTLTRLFYRNLNQGYPIDLSLSRARQGLISAYGSNQLYWALPVLYLHPEFNGFLTNDDAPDNREDLFTLPDPFETPLDSARREAPFTPKARRTLPRFPDVEAEDEPRPATRQGFTEDDDLDSFIGGLDSNTDEDADDASVFIKGLLDQLAPTESESGESEEPGSELKSQSRPPSDYSSSGLSANSPPSRPPVRQSSIIPPLPTGDNSSQSGEPRQSGGLNRWWQKFQRVPKLGMALAAMGVLAIALLGVWLFQNRELGVQDIGSKPTPSLPAIPARDPNVNLKTANTATVTSIAIEQFSQGKLATGQTAVEELLNRGALEQASAALAVVPRTQIDNPSVSFLSGRLAWQSVQAGSKDYNVSDARRYWETAHRAQPKSSTYLNALGFAYYAEGNFDRANQAWFDALYLIDASKPGETATGDTAKQEALTIYAGLAMGLYKSAQKQPVDKRAALLSESLKLRQKVITDDPLNFQPNALSKNWLWTDKAIKDWRSLLATSN